MHYDLIIIGGGLAGSASAVHAARSGWRVLVLERQRYPVDRLCGEFLSVEVQGLFRRLGVLAAVEAAGAVPIRQSWLTAPGGPVVRLPLPGTALGFSRYRLDALLFDAARAAGAEARDGTPVRTVEAEGDGFRVGFDGPDGPASATARLVIGAWGKRSGMDGKLDRPFLAERRGWVGFKAHYVRDGVGGGDLEDRIELHAFSGGYCGLNHVEPGADGTARVNVCWIASTDSLRASGGTAEGMLAGVMRTNQHLARRMDGLARSSARFEAVGGVTFALKGKSDSDLVMIGDTAGMIAPMCGDGMAMALHSAELAAPLVDAHLHGRTPRAALHAAYARAWDDRFRTRLRLGRTLHHLYVRPGVSSAALRLAHAFPAAGERLIRATRG